MSTRVNIAKVAPRQLPQSESTASRQGARADSAPSLLGQQRMMDGFVHTSRSHGPRSHHRPPPGPGPGPKPPPTPNPGPGSGLPVVPGRPPYVTELDATVTIDKYEGIQHGRNGDHEIAEAHITRILQVANQKIVDTQNVHLAMNVKSSIDPTGLPKEIPLKPGQTIEVEGEYIPASKANARNANGPAAVIHFTHSPAGYVVIDGQKYQ